MDMILFQENEQRRLQEEKMERRRKAQAEMKTKRSGKTACFFLALTIVKGAYLTFNNVNIFSSIVNLRYSPVLGPTSTRQWV